MGFVILGFAMWYSRRGMTTNVARKGLFLWQKFPKFVLGFLGLSIVFSVLLALFPAGSTHSYVAARIAALKNYSEWAFQFTFVGVGLRTTFRDMVKTGVKPLVVGVAAEAAVAVFTIGMVFVVADLLPTL
jgi:uncharacterized membrane protein YadS